MNVDSVRDYDDRFGIERIHFEPLVLPNGDSVGTADYYTEFMWSSIANVVEARNRAIYYDAIKVGKQPFRTGASLPVEIDFDGLQPEGLNGVTGPGLYFMNSGNNSPIWQRNIEEINRRIREHNQESENKLPLQPETRSCAENNLTQFYGAMSKHEVEGFEGVLLRIPDHLRVLTLAGPPLSNGEEVSKPIEGSDKELWIDDKTNVLYPCGSPCREALITAFGRELIVASFVLPEDSEKPQSAFAATVGDLEQFSSGKEHQIIAQSSEVLERLPQHLAAQYDLVA